MKPSEELLVRIMNGLAECLRDQLILKGGMLLRLLNSPRTTQDIDYLLISKESKKILVEPIKETLQGLNGVTLGKVNLNSRGIFIEVLDRTNDQTALVEISVVSKTHLPPEPLSTTPLAQRYSLTGRVVSTMALPEAFAHKIAACLERSVTRDLYDIALLEPMGPFDQNTLTDRLSALAVQRAKPKKIGFPEAADLLRSRLSELTEERIKTELHPRIPPETWPGLPTLIRASVLRVVQRLETLS